METLTSQVDVEKKNSIILLKVKGLARTFKSLCPNTVPLGLRFASQLKKECDHLIN